MSSGGGYQTIQLTWVSYPVLQALARLKQIMQGLSEEETMQSIAPPSAETIQITLRGRILAQLIQPDDEEIEEKTYLKKGKNQKVPVASVTFPESFYRSPLIILQFPKQMGRTPLLTLKDKKVELVVQVGKRKIKHKFKLKDMVVNGVLMI